MPLRSVGVARERSAARARTYALTHAFSRHHDFVGVAAAIGVLLGLAEQVCWGAPASSHGGVDAGASLSASADAGAVGVDGAVGVAVPNGDAGAASAALALPDDAAASGSPPARDAAPPPPLVAPPDRGPRLQTVVTARPPPPATPREDITAAASVLNPSDSPRARDDLATLLLEVPGANVTRRGGLGSFATLSLRGANPDEVRIYVDGIPLNQAVGGAVDLSTLPLGDVERIEIYRGSSPIAFGESALGGVVSITTRTPGATSASVRVGGGSFRTMFADATAGGSAGSLKLYGGVHMLRAMGDYPQTAPSVPGGYQPSVRENNDLSQWDGVFRASLTMPGRRELRAGLLGVLRDQGLPAEVNFHATTARTTTARGLGHLGYESRDDLGSSSRLRVTLFASAMRESFSDRLPEVVPVPTATRDVTRALGLTATAEKAMGDWGRLTVLLEGRTESYQPHNDLDPVAPTGYPATRQVASTGFELAVHWPRLKLDLLPSARLEASRDVRSGRDRNLVQRPADQPIDRAHPIFRLGFLRPLGGAVSARANVGRYARSPSFVELYGYNRGVVGNPELRAERGWNADLGVVATRGDGARTGIASATLFGAEVDDLIAWRTYSYQTRAENVSRARIWGVEAELRLRQRHLGLIAQATLTDARDKGDIAATRDRQIAHHPRTRGYGRLEWHQPVAFAGVVTVAYADIDASAGNFYSTGRYGGLPARVLAGGGVAVDHARSGLRLSVSALNLTDTRTRDFPGYPLPGRSFFASLGWSSADSRSSKTLE